MNDLLLIAGAGLLAGAMNGVAGGGSFVTLPALIAVGVPSVNANATSTVALVPSALASAYAYRKELGSNKTLFFILFVPTVIGALSGGLDFSKNFIRLGAVPADFKGDPASYADLKAAGVAMLGWGQFLTVLINFVILAFIIFLMIRSVNRMMAPKAEAPAGPSEETLLLREIRDSLKK